MRPQPDDSLRSEFGLFDQILNVPLVGLEVPGLSQLLNAEGVLEDRDVAEAGDGEHVGQDGATLAADERVKVELVPQLRHQSVHRQLGSEPGSVGFGIHDGPEGWIFRIDFSTIFRTFHFGQKPEKEKELGRFQNHFFV